MRIAVTAVGSFNLFLMQKYTVTLGEGWETSIQVAPFDHTM